MGTKNAPTAPSGKKGRPTPSRRKPPGERPLFTEWVVRRGRWVFILLAAVFVIGFVLYGVGNSGGAGLNDVLQNGNASNTPTTVPTPDVVKAALKATKERPTDASAWVSLGAAYSSAAAGLSSPAGALVDYSMSVTAYEKAKSLKPTDVDVLSALALAYNAEASAADSRAAELYNQSSSLQSARSNVELFAPASFGSLVDPLTQAMDSSISNRANALQQLTSPFYTQASAASKAALTVYLQLTTLRSTDPAIWFQMAEAARQTGDKTNEVKAFERFLALVPSDPLSPQVRSALDNLTKPTTAASTAAATTTAATTTKSTTTKATTPSSSTSPKTSTTK